MCAIPPSSGPAWDRDWPGPEKPISPSAVQLGAHCGKPDSCAMRSGWVVPVVINSLYTPALKPIGLETPLIVYTPLLALTIDSG